MEIDFGRLDRGTCCEVSISDCDSANRRWAQMFRRLRFGIWFGVLFFLVACLPSCTKSSGAVPVHGKISFHGEPISKAAVTFFPATGRAVGTGVSQGEYKIELMPGDYTATVDVVPEFPKGFKEGDPLPPPKVVLSDEYTVRTKSTLKATVKAGQAEPIDFDLK